MLGPKLDASHLHATSRSSKFEALISAAGAYRVCHASPPRKVQSPFVVPGPYAMPEIGTDRTAPRARASQRKANGRRDREELSFSIVFSLC